MDANVGSAVDGGMGWRDGEEGRAKWRGRSIAEGDDSHNWRFVLIGPPLHRTRRAVVLVKGQRHSEIVRSKAHRRPSVQGKIKRAKVKHE